MPNVCSTHRVSQHVKKNSVRRHVTHVVKVEDVSHLIVEQE